MRVSTGGARFAVFCRKFIKQTKGRWANQPLELEPWQLQAISETLKASPEVWIDVTNPADPWEELEEGLMLPRRAGVRVYREAYWQLSKKQGKSVMASALSLFMLLADGEPGAEVYAAATNKEQARIVFEQAKRMVQTSPVLSRCTKIYRDMIVVPETDSIYRVLSADAGGAEGLNPSTNIIDELARHESPDLYETMTSQSAAREQPLTFVITNAGVDEDSVCGSLYRQGLAVQARKRGARKDLFFFAPTVPKSLADDPKQWKRANPASWITQQSLEREAAKFPVEVFRRRFLNMWVSSEGSWLPAGVWRKLGSKTFEIEEGAPTWVAIDLGLRHDTAAVAWASPADMNDTESVIRLDAHVFGLHYDVERPKPPAHEIVEDQRLPISLVEAFIEDLARRFDVVELAYDPYKAERSAQMFDDAGLFDVVEFPQYDSYMVPATEAMYEEILEGRIVHPFDEVVEEHMENAVFAETGRGVRLAKRKSKRPMDAAVASAIAVWRCRSALIEGVARPSVTVIL